MGTMHLLISRFSLTQRHGTRTKTHASPEATFLVVSAITAMMTQRSKELPHLQALPSLLLFRPILPTNSMCKERTNCIQPSQSPLGCLPR